MVLTLDGAADASGVAGAWFVQTVKRMLDCVNLVKSLHSSTVICHVGVCTKLLLGLMLNTVLVPGIPTI